MSQVAPAQAPLLCLDRVAFRYRGRHAEARGPLWTLQDVSLSIEAGEFVGIIGPNGSGKTSLLKLMGGLLQPDQGTVAMQGEPLLEIEPERLARFRSALFPEEPVGFPFSVTDFVLMGRYPHRRTRGLFTGWAWDTTEDREIAWRAMQEVELAHLAHEPIDRISTGERQRACLARALAQGPRMLLLDEPTAHLDLHHIVQLAGCLRRLHREQGLTLVLVTHDLNLASQLCTRILLLSNGRIAGLGPPSDVMRDGPLSAAYGCPLTVDQHPDTQRPRITVHMPMH